MTTSQNISRQFLPSLPVRWAGARSLAAAFMVLLAVAVGLGLGSDARAASNGTPPGPSYVVRPESNQPKSEIGLGYFTLTLQPGQTQVLRVAIKNLGTNALAVYNYPTDGVAMSAGGIGYGTREIRPSLVGTWITLSLGQLTLAPGETRSIAATVHVPSGMAAGQYVGGVAFEDQDVQQQHMGSHIAINVHYRQVIAIVVTVPGKHAYAAKVIGVALHPLDTGCEATVTLQSTGNMLWKGTGTLQIGNTNQSTSIPFTIGSLLAGAVVSIPVSMPSLILRPGSYDVAVRIAAAAGGGTGAWNGLVPLTTAASQNPNGTLVPTVVLQPNAQSTRVVPATPALPATPKRGTTAQPTSVPILPVMAVIVVALLLLGAFVLRPATRRKPQSLLGLEYTQHARDQMALRAVSQAEVEQVFADRGITYPDQYGNPCYVRMVAGRRIRAVVARGSHPPLLVTVVSQAGEQ